MNKPADLFAGDALRRKRANGYFAALDRGEILSGRVVQIMEPDGVRVAIGPAVILARTTGGCPGLGYHTFEVVMPGERPVLKLVEPKLDGGLDLIVDPSAEKAQSGMGKRFDRRV